MENNANFIPEIYIGENGNWFINNYDTGVKARGDDGITPHIGMNGNWYIGDTDTGVPATGPKGDKGDKGEQGPVGPVNIANNLEMTEEGYALDARQGKILNDRFPLFKVQSIATGSIPGNTAKEVTAALNIPDGYKLITWIPRGVAGSSGKLHLNGWGGSNDSYKFGIANSSTSTASGTLYIILVCEKL